MIAACVACYASWRVNIVDVECRKRVTVRQMDIGPILSFGFSHCIKLAVSVYTARMVSLMAQEHIQATSSCCLPDDPIRHVLCGVGPGWSVIVSR
jgi:hypothetical protein